MPIPLDIGPALASDNLVVLDALTHPSSATRMSTFVDHEGDVYGVRLIWSKIRQNSSDRLNSPVAFVFASPFRHGVTAYARHLYSSRGCK